MSYRDEVLSRAECLFEADVSLNEFIERCDPQTMELDELTCFFPDLADHTDVAAHRCFVVAVACCCIPSTTSLYTPEFTAWLDALFAHPRFAEAMRHWLDLDIERANRVGGRRHYEVNDAWYLAA